MCLVEHESRKAIVGSCWQKGGKRMLTGNVGKCLQQTVIVDIVLHHIAIAVVDAAGACVSSTTHG